MRQTHGTREVRTWRVQPSTAEPLRQPAQLVVRDLLAVAAAPATADPTGDEGERRWQERANCLGVDPDLFFPERLAASTREAKAVCGSCEVHADAPWSTPSTTPRSSGSGAVFSRAGTTPAATSTGARAQERRVRLTHPDTPSPCGGGESGGVTVRSARPCQVSR